MQDLLTDLAGPDSRRAQQAVAALAGQPLPLPALALCAWAWHRWAADPATLPGARFRQFQVNRLGWRAADDWGAAPAIQAALGELLHTQLATEHEALLRAAAGFNRIFPTKVYVGNGDVGGYEFDCQQLWRDLEPYRDWFAEALAWSEALRCEWVTLAQICWSHFRWQADDWFYGTFSAPACGYLLARAVTLAVSYPIQYYYAYQQLPAPYIEQEPPTEGEELALQSGLGLTYFYYAEYCQHHAADPRQALATYARFLAAEPTCQPDNRFRLFCRDATTRSYPPSVQQALTETGHLHRQLGNLPAARAAYEQAIAAQPDNFEAPYGALADLLHGQGDQPAALFWLARQAEVYRQTTLQDAGFRTTGVGSRLFYDPTRPEPQELAHYPGLGGWWEPAARVRVLEVNELYRELADSYYYELADYESAGRYYKRYLAGLLALYPPAPQRRARQLDAAASQLRLAEEQGDYWQARSLAEKLLRLDPHNSAARHCLARLRKRFA